MGNQSSTIQESKAIVKPANDTYTSKKLEYKQTGLRAVVVGCNYSKTNCPLTGCVSDAQVFLSFLRDRKYGSKAEILLLTDEGDEKYCPTYQNILKSLKWLASGEPVDSFHTMDNFESKAEDGVTLVFYYAGHGTQVLDTNGDESDRKDECLCPVKPSGEFDEVLIDDTLSQTVSTLMKPENFWIIFTDCCHSGTVSDLKYKLSGKCFIRNGNYPDSKSPIVHFGACYDRETAKEGTVNSGERHGYFTFSIIKALKGMRLSVGATHDRCLSGMTSYVSKLDQFPQVSAGQSVITYSTLLPF